MPLTIALLILTLTLHKLTQPEHWNNMLYLNISSATPLCYSITGMSDCTNLTMCTPLGSAGIAPLCVASVNLHSCKIVVVEYLQAN